MSDTINVHLPYKLIHARTYGTCSSLIRIMSMSMSMEEAVMVRC
jgi:hypothetical protein